MIEFYTLRGTALYGSDRTTEQRVCQAASDYKHALKNKNFAEASGGIENLLKDLFLFTELWEKET